jgi:cytidylate kinase
LWYGIAMTKKHIITLAGRPGSGKSTTSKKLAAKLGYDRFSSGELFRSIATKRGVDVLTINLTAETEKAIDLEVDEKLREMGSQQDSLVIDSRMAWHWMPYSFKVYLDLDILEASKRITTDKDDLREEAERIPHDPHEYAKLLQERLDSETRRYQSLYQQNPYDPKNYDLVVDTAINNPDEVAEIIVKSYLDWLKE